MKHTILFLAANPLGTGRLALDQECAAIERELRMTTGRDDFDFRSRWGVSVDELMRHLNELQPTILHFSGHGSTGAPGPSPAHGAPHRDIEIPRGAGIFLQDERSSQYVSDRALAKMIASASPSTYMVVLNACYSANVAESLRRVVGCVIGMDGAVGDAAARAFAVAFYRALGNRRSVGNAIAQAAATLAAKQLPDALPVCRTRDDLSAEQIFLPTSDHHSPAAELPPVAKPGPPRVAAAAIFTLLPAWLRVALAIGLAVTALGVYLALDRRGGRSVDTAIAPGAQPENAAPTPSAAPSRDGMVRIAGATFELGIPDPASFRRWCEDLGEPAGACDEVLGRAAELHGTTQIPTFDLDRFEVTRAQLATWLEGLLARGDAIVSNGQIVRQEDSQPLADFRQCDPVVTLRGARIEISRGFERGAGACMTFAAASDYCRDRSAALPTLAQWQLAAAGREHRLLPWHGMTVSCNDAVFGRDPGGPCAREEQRAQSIDRVDRDVTPEGVHAMGGNVSEWVASPARTAYGVLEHLTAGGSWVGGPVDVSTAKVRWLGTPPLAATIGFRCAITVR